MKSAHCPEQGSIILDIEEWLIVYRSQSQTHAHYKCESKSENLPQMISSYTEILQEIFTTHKTKT